MIATMPLVFWFRLAESELKLDGTARNNSFGFALFLHAGLNGSKQFLDYIPSPGKIRDARRFHVEVPKALLFVRAIQRHDHISDIKAIIGTNSEPKFAAFLIQVVIRWCFRVLSAAMGTSCARRKAFSASSIACMYRKYVGILSVLSESYSRFAAFWYCSANPKNEIACSSAAGGLFFCAILLQD